MPYLKHIAEPSKRQLLMELRAGPRTVNDLVDATKLKQPNVSNHLAKLRDANVVKATKLGRQVFYSLANSAVEAALLQFLPNPPAENTPAGLDEMIKKYSRSAVAGNETGCQQIIDHLITHKVPLVTIYQDVLAASMGMVGLWYEVGAVDIGQEHLASAITERMMARVMHFAPPVRPTANAAVIGCVAGNQHSIGARMLSDLLRLKGWRTFYLGANVPDHSFANTIREHKPQLVLASVAYSEDRGTALNLIRKLRADFNGLIRIGVGGVQVKHKPEEFTAAGADFTSADLKTFSESVLPRLTFSDVEPTGNYS